jgi:hypothetical protein
MPNRGNPSLGEIFKAFLADKRVAFQIQKNVAVRRLRKTNTCTNTAASAELGCYARACQSLLAEPPLR